jgi:hypothetical protein
MFRHLTWRFLELLHISTFLLLLGSKSIASTPMPSNPKQLNSRYTRKYPEMTVTSWLTQVLHETAAIPESSEVTSFKGQTLTGGCHFKVSQLNLEFSGAPEKPPTQLVIKLLWWEKPWYEKLLLFIKKQFGSLDREVMYLNSYEIESRFYTHFSKVIQGNALWLIIGNI